MNSGNWGASSLRPEIVVTIPVHDLEPACPNGSWLKEFRVDFLPISEVEKFIRKAEGYGPNILTMRDKDERGQYSGDTGHKLSLLCDSHGSIIDVEYRHLDRFLCHFPVNKKIIYSIHNFKDEISPEEIANMIDSLPYGESILKVAMKIRNVKKYLELAAEYSGKLLLIDLNSTANRLLLAMISGTYLYSSYKEMLAPNQPDYKFADSILRKIYQ